MIATTDQIKNQLVPRVQKAIRQVANNVTTDTAIISSGLQLAIGDNQPVNKSVWLDTSDYASVNGAIATYSPTANGGNIKFEVSDTEPTDTSVAWINTSGYST